jgi:hypothetical protein
MKLRNSFVTAGFAALALAGASVLASAGSAQALSVYFSPTGGELVDTDDIPDIETTTGSTVSFDLFLETFAIPNTTTSPGVASIEYLLNWDTDELKLLSGVNGPKFETDYFSIVEPPTAVAGAITYKQKNLDGSVIAAPWKSDVKLATFKFQALKLNNDSLSDFSTALTKALKPPTALKPDGVPFLSVQSSQVQMVEVQAKAVPTPALLPGLAAFGMSLVRKRKQEQAA